MGEQVIESNELSEMNETRMRYASVLPDETFSHPSLHWQSLLIHIRPSSASYPDGTLSLTPESEVFVTGFAFFVQFGAFFLDI
jgi:hypothetical protein